MCYAIGTYFQKWLLDCILVSPDPDQVDDDIDDDYDDNNNNNSDINNNYNRINNNILQYSSYPSSQRNFALPEFSVLCIFSFEVFTDHVSSYSIHPLFPSFVLLLVLLGTYSK